MRISLPHDFTPLEHQRRYMTYFDQGGTRAFWVVHRRGGKDLTALHQMAKMAHERIGLYWHTLPTYAQCRKVIWDGFRSDGKRIISNVFPDAIVKARNEQAMRIELKSGSIIQLVGSDNYDSLVGSNPIGVTFSEYALCKPAAYEYIRPILAANGGWCSWITTPRGHNHAYKQWLIAQKAPGWFAETQTVRDTNLLPATILEDELAAGMPPAMVNQEYLCDWHAALVGSVWGDLLEELLKRGGLEPWEPAQDEVFTSWDLGMSDSTAIWFFRASPDGVEFIDHFEAHGKPISFYADEIERRGYRYAKHWLPHDANARHLSTGTSVLEQLAARFGRGMVAIGPRMSLLDGIQAGRWLLQQPGTRFHPTKCEQGVEALRSYAYEYDEETRVYSNKPAHNWASHTADAFRYAAVVSRVSGIFKPRKPAPEEPRIYAAPLNYQLTLDALFTQRDRRPRARRI